MSLIGLSCRIFQIGKQSKIKWPCSHLSSCLQQRLCSTTSEIPKLQHGTSLPTIIDFPSFQTRSIQAPREALVETLYDEDSVGLVSLNPEVFGQLPLLHVMHDNIKWQTQYKHINYNHALSRHECRGGGRKPWPQKGLGRARHGSRRSPLFLKGGVAHGPRRYTTKFYMLAYGNRVLGLTSALSAKFAQDDLKVVRSLDVASSAPEPLLELLEQRLWGPSVLFVHTDDIMPEKICKATETIGHINLMPVYGLNVYSMLKHDTLVLTVPALRLLEERLMHAIYNTAGAHLHSPTQLL
ncbi:39S ribosomal protein L4, mitochondrial isoform X2 [Hyalella azteca]|uniref:Large ribosomal subunit protein uL4m n=1 Tax=Hyalella azteca TaxID=294128 RepID=A0A979FF88_HYAAZ|nr:39S ribosomal protein L4, mitochondrial isoform X2 [Hyalella azteca]